MRSGSLRERESEREQTKRETQAVRASSKEGRDASWQCCGRRMCNDSSLIRWQPASCNGNGETGNCVSVIRIWQRIAERMRKLLCCLPCQTLSFIQSSKRIGGIELTFWALHIAIKFCLAKILTCLCHTSFAKHQKADPLLSYVCTFVYLSPSSTHAQLKLGPASSFDRFSFNFPVCLCVCVFPQLFLIAWQLVLFFNLPSIFLDFSRAKTLQL